MTAAGLRPQLNPLALDGYARPLPTLNQFLTNRPSAMITSRPIMAAVPEIHWKREAIAGFDRAISTQIPRKGPGNLDPNIKVSTSGKHQTEELADEE